ncbi:MAG: hypothetical protein JWL72_3487 [Ilumatobacteraceae bacterium]|nr:hypothetical protein [Ilumatobacteraceae bacterium]
MLKTLRKPLKPVYRSMIIAAAWSNRRDIGRWAKFAKRAAMPATRPSPSDLKLEARVRASLSCDPILRADPSIHDLRVRDGIVVLETPADWHNKRLALARLGQLKGVESVHTATDVNEQNWLDVDVLDVERDVVTARA